MGGTPSIVQYVFDPKIIIYERYNMNKKKTGCSFQSFWEPIKNKI